MLWLKKFFVLILAIVLFSQTFSQQTCKLTVVVTGVRKISGYMEISLYNNPASFPKENKEFMTRRVPVTSRHVKAEFLVPCGTYAIALYHDENGNGQCDMNFMGVPVEPFAFSNNVKPRIHAPSFDQCKFTTQADTKIRIKLLRYGL